MFAQGFDEAEARLGPEIAIDEQIFVGIAQYVVKKSGSRRIARPRAASPIVQ